MTGPVTAFEKTFAEWLGAERSLPEESQHGEAVSRTRLAPMRSRSP